MTVLDNDSSPSDHAAGVITRREAIQRVTALLGGLTLVGGTGLLAACERERPAIAPQTPIGQFTVDDIGQGEVPFRSQHQWPRPAADTS